MKNSIHTKVTDADKCKHDKAYSISYFVSKIRKKLLLQVLVIYTRYLLGGAFVFASIIKLKGRRFTSQSGASDPIDSAFHFFETMYQSGIYWKFIGAGQFIAGALLLTQRFSLLGAALNLPIILNIFVITISYDFNLTPIITGLMLLANLFLLFWDRNRLLVFINESPLPDNGKLLETEKIWEYGGFILLLFTVVYRIYTDNYQVVFWFGACIITGLVTYVIGMGKRKLI